MLRTTCNAVGGIHLSVCVLVWHLTHLLRCVCDYMCVCGSADVPVIVLHVCVCVDSRLLALTTNVKSLWSWPQFLVIANKMLRTFATPPATATALVTDTSLVLTTALCLRVGFLKPLSVCVCVDFLAVDRGSSLSLRLLMTLGFCFGSQHFG